jgi:hypothetical protein
MLINIFENVPTVFGKKHTSGRLVAHRPARGGAGPAAGELEPRELAPPHGGRVGHSAHSGRVWGSRRCARRSWRGWRCKKVELGFVVLGHDGLLFALLECYRGIWKNLSKCIALPQNTTSRASKRCSLGLEALSK